MATHQNDANALFSGLGLLELVDETLEAPEEVVAEPADLTGEDTVEAEMLVADDAGDEAMDTDAKIEALSDDAETLEDVAVAMESMIANGGMSRDAAAVTGLTVAAIRRRWGMRKPVIASMEAFGGDTSRLTASQESLEGVKQTLKTFWQAFVAMLNKFWQSAVNWVKSLFDVAGKVKARAEDIKAKAAKTTGKPKATTIPAAMFNKMNDLHLSGKAPNGDQLGAAMALIVKHIGNLKEDSKLLEATSNDYINLMEAEIAAGAETRGAGLVAKITEELGHFAGANDLSHDGGARGGEGVTTKISDELPGGRALLVSYPTAGKTADQTAKAATKLFNLAIAPFATKAPAITANGEFTTMFVPAIGKNCDRIIEICNGIAEYNSTGDARKAAGEKIKAAVGKVSDAVDKKGEGGAAEYRSVKDTAEAAGLFYRKVVSFEGQVIAYALKTSRSVLTLCDRSLQQYETAPEAAKPAPEAKPEGDAAGA